GRVIGNVENAARADHLAVGLMNHRPYAEPFTGFAIDHALQRRASAVAVPDTARNESHRLCVAIERKRILDVAFDVPFSNEQPFGLNRVHARRARTSNVRSGAVLPLTTTGSISRTSKKSLTSSYVDSLMMIWPPSATL